MKKGKLFIICILIFMSQTACFNFQKAKFPEKKYFLLEIERSGQPVSAGFASGIKIDRIKVASGFDGNAFIYRNGPATYSSDYYNGFFIAPADMFTHNMTKWLKDSGCFGLISATSGFVDTPYVLKAEVPAFYADFSEKKNQKAVLEIDFYLFDTSASEYKNIFSKDYQEEVPIKGSQPEDMVSAWGECLKKILNAFETDLIGSLGNKNNQPQDE